MLKRVSLTMLAAGALLMAEGRIARPGTINYAEGQVILNGRTVGSSQIGSAEVAPGQVLETASGKAEMLLTPGVFLRLSDQSAVRMISPSLTNTQVELLRGEAMVEADQVQKENRISVVDHGSTAVLEKHGIYEFRADQPMVAVFDGKLNVEQDDHSIHVGKGKELLLGQVKTQKFDRDAMEASDPLYSWSRLRSEYTAEANASMAQTIVVGGPGWYGTGWYWNPYFSSFAFMPGDGFLYSPFGYGWGFYSPTYFQAYVPYGYYGRGYYGRGYYGRGYVGRGFAGRPGITTAPRVAAPAVAPQMSAPRMAAPRMSAPAMHMGGGGFGGHFGGRRR